MTTPFDLCRRGAAAAFSLALLLLATAASAQQGATDSHWQAWVGCWQPTGAADAAAAPLVCVVPAGGSAVEVMTVADGKVAHRERIEAAEQAPSTRDQCTGWESAVLSADGRRVYRSSEHTCPGDLRHRATALMAMSPDGEWLDVQGISTGGYTGVRVTRYRDVGVPASLPAEVAAALGGQTLGASAARMAATVSITPADVVEATRRVDAEVVEAWLVERRQGFDMDARQLVQLSKAGVPERVIDLMVALSYPEVFAIDADAREGEFRPEEDTASPRTPRPLPGYGVGPWGYPGYGRGYDPRYGGYGYGGYGYGYGRYGRYGGYPVVIVRRGADDGETAGRSRAKAVNGRGYTQGRESSSGRSSPRPNSSPSGGSSASGSSGSSGGSSSGSAPARTAKPRGDG